MMNEKKDKSYKKNLEPTAKFIHDLCEQQEVTISGIVSAKKEGQCSFNFDAGLMEVTLSTDNTDESIEEIETSRNGSDTANPLRVKSDSGCYVATTAYRSLTELYCCDSVVLEKLLFSLSQLMSSEWNCKKKYYYRFLVPRPPEMLIWNSIQTDSSYSDFDNDRPNNLVKIPLEKERQIHVFLSGVNFDQNKLEYLTIESQAPCTYTEMHEYMYAISLSLGLVTTIAPFDYAFVIASEIPDFGGKIMGGMIKLRSTIKSQYKLQFSAPIKEKDFAKLVSMLHRNKNLARAAMMFLVASDDIEYLGPLYSVVLETICLELFKENKDIFEECLIEKPWGKDFKNNDEKLTKPFELLKSIKYDLSEVEKLIIKTRNSFLHGDIPKGGESADKFESVDELQYISSELRRLCMILLFRYVGIKEPQPAIILYDEKVKQTVDEKLLRRKQKEEEEKEKKKNSTRKSQGKEKSPQPTKKPEASV